MKKNILAIVALFLGIMIIGCSKDPAPYTQEATAKLAKAGQSVGQPDGKPGMSKEDILKIYYSHFEKIYSKAGYDLEKSIIQFDSDFKKDPTGAFAQGNEVLVYLVIFQLSEMRKDKTIDFAKAVPTTVINVIDSFAAIESEKKKKEEELAAQQKKIREDEIAVQQQKAEEEKAAEIKRREEANAAYEKERTEKDAAEKKKIDDFVKAQRNEQREANKNRNTRR